jgi:hypothetical protein
VRDDLAHLTPEALAQLTNVGLVKRAVRELAGGYRPKIELDDAQTLTAHFDDGIECTWPQGTTIRNALCNCGAAGLCRHRLIAALAYREQAAFDGEDGQQLSPAMRDVASVSDEDLGRLIPVGLMQAAERMRSEGIVVDVHRRGAGEPCDTARLPSATVRFWAGGAIEAARCDCVAASACEHVALGVWAFRAAQGSNAGATTTAVPLGPPARRHAVDRAPFELAIQTLLQHGVVQGSGPLAQGFTAARVSAADAAWLGLLLADFENWAEAYAQRSALYEPTDGVDLVAELGLRLAAGVLPGRAAAVLGVGQASETALDRLRLMGLGARTRRDGESRLTTLVMADIDTGTRLVLRHTWQVPDNRAAKEAELRAAERVAPGVMLEAIAQGQLLAQQASRRADGSIRLARARSSQNSVLPQPGDWSNLSPPLRYSSVAALRAAALSQPNAALQPRHAARRHVVFSPQQVQAVRYDPNDQSLLAILADDAEDVVLLQRTHERHAPHALDSIAAALAGHFGPLRHVAGTLEWQDGTPRIEPWALACDRLVIPDFISGPSGALSDVELGRAPQESSDAVALTLDRLRRHLAVWLHHGLRRLPSRWSGEGVGLARELSTVGMNELAQRLLDMQALCNKDALGEAAGAFLSLASIHRLHLDAMESQRAAG